MSETLYIQINRNIQVDKREITIGDVAALLCKNAGITARVKTIKLITLPDVPKRRVSFSVITVMEKIEKVYPDLQLVSIGESDFIVDYIRQKKKSRVWQGRVGGFVSGSVSGADGSICFRFYVCRKFLCHHGIQQ